MGLFFEWSQNKAISNTKKHGVDFSEASTIFGDPFSLTISDSYNSVGEERFITIGRSLKNRTLVVVHSERNGNIRIISSRGATRREKIFYEEGEYKIKEPMLVEYNFRSGERGKYAARYAEDVNIVRLDADVAEVFQDHDSVNQALRAMAKIIHSHEQKHHYG